LQKQPEDKEVLPEDANIMTCTTQDMAQQQPSSDRPESENDPNDSGTTSIIIDTAAASKDFDSTDIPSEVSPSSSSTDNTNDNNECLGHSHFEETHVNMV
jgi:hypothetical protein